MKKLIILIFALSFNKSNAQLTSSALPIIVINTSGQTIVDEPKVLVEFKVIFNGAGKINNVTDAPTHYDSYAGIELRGSSSQGFPKKPYGLELRTKTGEENPFELLGMPKDADWILFASYNEKSLMHNVLTMSLSRQMGMYASRTKYVELMLNGSYQGVYVLMEKVKRDDNRVNISTLKETDITGDQLTGGYIIKVDKGTGTNIGSFKARYPNTGTNFSSYYYDSPKTINTTQKNYIKDYVGKFEDAVFSTDFKDPEKGYRKYIDVVSFAKMFIINEVSRNIDGYRISSYFYKDRDSKNPKLLAGPPWDYDISYGNADYCDGKRSDLFAYRFKDVCPGDFWQVPFFWEKLISDPAFVADLRSIYFEQRKAGGVLDYDRIAKEIDTMRDELQAPQQRNFQKWPIIGTYVWPSPQPIASSWQGEVNELKDWLKARLIWLDNNMPKEFVVTANEISDKSLIVTAFPNPFIDKLNVNVISNKDVEAQLQIIDILGKIVYDKKIFLKAGENISDIDVPSQLYQQTINMLRVITKDGNMELQKVINTK